MASRLLEKLAKRCLSDSGEREAFIAALLQGHNAQHSLLWLRGEVRTQSPFAVLPPASFQPQFIDRVTESEHAGKHELHQQGAYYCLDLSSVFAASVLQGIPQEKRPSRILDLCSAPGGKGIFAWRMFSPELLVCNEVIGNRIPALLANAKRCAIAPVLISNNDPAKLAEYLPRSFPLVIVDAPCSGQSLLVKGKPVPGCFHERTIGMNANRQKRIIANASQVVSPGGYLAYMTCTFSREEDEGVVEWLLKKFPDFQICEVPTLAEFRSTLSEHACYRLWPHQGLGAGAFTALLRYVPEGSTNPPNVELLRRVWTSQP